MVTWFDFKFIQLFEFIEFISTEAKILIYRKWGIVLPSNQSQPSIKSIHQKYMALARGQSDVANDFSFPTQMITILVFRMWSFCGNREILFRKFLHESHLKLIIPNRQLSWSMFGIILSL